MKRSRKIISFILVLCLVLSSTPFVLPAAAATYLPTFVQVSAGGDHYLALDDDGNVWVKGDNTYYQHGDGTTVSSDEWEQISWFPYISLEIVKVAAGEYHSLALDTNGQLWIWGHYANTDYTTPQSLLQGITDVSVKGNNNLATDGYNAFEWGTSGITGFVSSPLFDYYIAYNSPIYGPLNYIECGYDKLFVGDLNGTAPGEILSSDYSLAPASTRTSLDVAVTSGVDGTWLLDDDGNVWKSAPAPTNQTQVIGLVDIVQISAGGPGLNYALDAYGDVYDMETGVDTRIDNIVQISAGENKVLALTTNGTIYEWDAEGNATYYDETTGYNLYTFVAPQTGAYCFYTTGSLDTEGYLSNVMFSPIMDSDNRDATYYWSGYPDPRSPIDYNFMIQVYLTAGQTYNLEVYSPSAGAFNLYRKYLGDTMPLSGDELSYDPYWSTDYNCYNYALNTQYMGFMQPGYAGGYYIDYVYWTYMDVEDVADEFIAACEADAYALGGIFNQIGEDDAPQDGCYKVALVLIHNGGSTGDYHWYRQNDDGTWSNKPGASDVQNFDLSGQTTYYPRPDVSNTYEYNYFVGYFEISDLSSAQQMSRMAGAPLSTPPLEDEYSLSDFAFLEADLTVAEVEAELGGANSHLGSGIIRDVYNLDDGRKVVLDYGMYRDALIDAYILNADGTKTDLI